MVNEEVEVDLEVELVIVPVGVIIRVDLGRSLVREGLVEEDSIMSQLPMKKARIGIKNKEQLYHLLFISG